MLELEQQTILTFRTNFQYYSNLKLSYPDQILLSEPMTRFFYSVNSRAYTSAFIRSKDIPNPKSHHLTSQSMDNLKPPYKLSDSVLITTSTSFESFTLPDIKVSRNSATQYINLTSSYFPREPALTNLNHFPRLRYLSLHDCSLLTLPRRLLDPPKTLEYIDLSLNYLCDLPDNLQWSHIKGLNLSQNAFVDWPTSLCSEVLPMLGFLSIAGNAIKTSLDGIGSFKYLKVIDCSHTILATIPSWLSQCSNLEIVRFNGASELVRFPLKYLEQFETLTFADFSGVEIYCGNVKFGTAMTLLVLKGTNRNDCPEGDFAVVT
jgi:Leucine-rich repeat (LRR) protein